MAFDPEDKIKWEELAPSLQKKFDEMEQKIADAIKNLNDVLAKTLTEIDNKVNNITNNINTVINDVPVDLPGDPGGVTNYVVSGQNYDGYYGYGGDTYATFGAVNNCVNASGTLISHPGGWGTARYVAQCNNPTPVPNKGTFKLMEVINKIASVSHYHRYVTSVRNCNCNCNCSSSH